MIKGLQAQRRSEWGFTLIEVMVVIIMIGILAAIAVPIYSNYVYRARTSEAVTTLGAIKTYMLERANAMGAWPTQAELNAEFNNFNDLYYFNTPPTIVPSSVASPSGVANVPITTTPHIGITMTVNSATFGTTGDTLQLDIDPTTKNNNGWSGTVRTKWAKHLPALAGTPAS
ncbi:MAG: pilin [bacterium]